jgi:RHH-type proline utilization regulon transcriptional repressor/proline dehydrogenase/delta 1-pyrroline-5-carboxylate dehydrogenase
MDTEFESKVRQTALQLYEQTAGKSTSLFDQGTWTGKVLRRCMRDEPFKVEFFRFIDVFPSLTTPKSLSKHMEEYFGAFRGSLPDEFNLTQTGKAGDLSKNIVGLGEQLIAASSTQAALPVLESLRSEGMGFSADLLGEAVVSESEAETYVERYLELLNTLDKVQTRWQPLGGGAGTLDWGHAPKINISLKPSALYSQMNPRAFEYSVDRAKEHLRPIFRKAMEVGAHVCLDMEHYHTKNLTLALYRSLLGENEFRGYPHSGIVIQCYLRDSESDLRDLVGWARKTGQQVTIRLVKGAYWESETVTAQKMNWPVPFYVNKYHTDANFEKMARYLLESHQWINLACASQNIRSLASVIELTLELGLPPERVEYQLLYGMAEPVRNALQARGLPIRIYTPIGDMVPGMAYLVRRLLETTSRESFLRQIFVEGFPLDELLDNPLKRPEAFSLSEPSLGEAHPAMDEEVFRNEPHLDWTLSENRERFRQSLEAVQAALPYRVPLFVGGRSKKTKKEIRATNPNHPEQIVGIVSSAATTDVNRAVSAALKAFPAWRETSPADRAKCLFRAAEVARGIRHRLAALQVYEVGKSWSEADADVCEAIDFLEYYGREMLRISRPRPMSSVLGEDSRLVYDPRGVAAVIAPWNFPLAISTGMTAAALVTGNTVVYKPSSNSCVTGSMIYDLFKEARLPRGVLNFLPGDGDAVGDSLVGHTDISLIAFTGSKEVGLRIIELAGKTPEGADHVKAVVAEMGGKNAIVVDDDADLDQVVGHVLQSAFGYQGQKCSACSRLIVVRDAHDKLVQRLKAAAESIDLGVPEDPQTMVGAVIDASAKRKIMEYIGIGKKEGRVSLQRGLASAKGHFVPITIFTGIQPDHRIAQEEIFGPVLSVIRADSFQEALDAANDTPYALTGAVFSRSPANIDLAKRTFRVGNLYINTGCTGAIVGRHPFGGFKMSGVGSKAGGPDYLLQFMVPRNTVENTFRRGFAPTRRE